MGARMAVPWDELAARVDIVTVIGEHVHLRRSGREWIGLCPFHAEKTPSFTVNPERQFFYCFGCQAGGDVYTFLMRHKGLSFAEAAEEVARRAGVDLGAFVYSERDRQAWESRRRALAACRAAADFFRRCLLQHPSAAPARRYLKERGLSEEVGQRFELGFSPEDPRLLLEALREAGVSQEAALEAGLLVPGRSGTGGGSEAPAPGRAEGRAAPRPRFRGRLMFPIRDVRGQVVGFGARKLAEAAWGPKYLNSPQGPLFNKSEVLFGLWEARDGIREAGFGLLVEGYTDVLALHQAGITQAAATLGTALTPRQAALLQRYTSEVVVAFDGDGAGERAALRSLEILSEAGLRVRVLALPRGMDPDEYVKREGPQGFRRRIEDAMPLTEFRLKMALRGHRLDTVEGRARAVEAVLPVLARVPSAVEREGYVQRLSRALHVSEEALQADLERYVRRTEPPAAGHAGGSFRHRLAGKRHNKRGFAPVSGELRRDGPSPSRTRFSRGPEGGPRRTTPTRAREAAMAQVERGLLRRMLVSPRDALAVWEYVGDVGFGDAARQTAAEALVERARGVLEGAVAGDWPGDPWPVPEPEPLGTGALASSEGAGSGAEVPGDEQWPAWAQWLREQRLRDELLAIEGRLDAEAECAGDRRDVQEALRLIGLLVEYHGVRLRAAAGKARRLEVAQQGFADGS